MSESNNLLEGVAALLWPIIVIAILFRFGPTVINILKKSHKITLKIAGQELTTEEAISELDDKVHILLLLIKGFITDFEYEKLRGLANYGPFPVRFHWDMYKELRRLDALRYIQPQQGYGIDSIIERDGSGDQFDLKQYVYITPDGQNFLKLRDELLRSS